MKRLVGAAAKREGAKRALEHEAVGTACGAAVGAAAGSIGGPAGLVVGSIMGGVAGAMAAAAIEWADEATEAHRRRLDDAIGLSGGDLGAPNLRHPPARFGAYSSASAGGSSGGGEAAAEGPMQAPSDG